MSTIVRCLGNLARPRPDSFYVGNQCRAKRNPLFCGLAPRGVDIQVMLCLQCTPLCSVFSFFQARELSVLCLVQRLGGYWCSRLSTIRASSLPQAFSGSEFDRESSPSLSGGPGLVRRREPMTATIDNIEPQIDWEIHNDGYGLLFRITYSVSSTGNNSIRGVVFLVIRSLSCVAWDPGKVPVAQSVFTANKTCSWSKVSLDYLLVVPISTDGSIPGTRS